MKRQNIGGFVTGVVLLVGMAAWVSTAPYLSNSGLARTLGLEPEAMITRP